MSTAWRIAARSFIVAGLSGAGTLVAAQICSGPVSGSGNSGPGFTGATCLPNGQCQEFMLPAARQSCEFSYYWAATDADCGSPGACFPGGECVLDPESLPVFNADDCVYSCTEFPGHSAVCEARYTYEEYQCKCSQDPPSVPVGACTEISAGLCLVTTEEICVASGFVYLGDGMSCDPAAVPASNTVGAMVLATLLLLSLGFVARRSRA